MSSASQPPSSTVSLPEHLREPLRTALPHLPPDLAGDVERHLPLDSIPYSVLLSVSRWARDDAKRCGLDPHDYTMLALLAGTRTTPNANFVNTGKDALAPRQARSDRKAITALANALFSIAGAGTAGWWAASSSGWKNELCVLIGFFVATVVAVSEAILFIIWQRRRDSKPRTRRVVRRIVATLPSDEPDAPTAVIPVVEDDESALRQRKASTAAANVDDWSAK